MTNDDAPSSQGMQNEKYDGSLAKNIVMQNEKYDGSLLPKKHNFFEAKAKARMDSVSGSIISFLFINRFQTHIHSR